MTTGETIFRLASDVELILMGDLPALRGLVACLSSDNQAFFSDDERQPLVSVAHEKAVEIEDRLKRIMIALFVAAGKPEAARGWDDPDADEDVEMLFADELPAGDSKK